MKNQLCLAADIGGTNTRIALFDSEVLLEDTCVTYSNNKYDSFESILAEYLDRVSISSVTHAELPPQGPSKEDAKMTNLSWSFSEGSIASITGAAHVGIINDLQAQGYGLKSLDSSQVESIRIGEHNSNPNETKLVCGMGTGFNAAPVFKVGQKTFVPPSEAGHSQISLADKNYRSIFSNIASENSFVSVEDILSGRGIENVGKALNGRTETAAQIMQKASQGDENSKKLLSL